MIVTIYGVRKTIQQVAAFLDAPVSTVRNAVREGRFSEAWLRAYDKRRYQRVTR